MIDNSQELFTVVDERDNILGYHTRGECHADVSLIHRAVGIVLYNAAAELLLQRRSMYKDTSPGMWTMAAGGHVDQGETYHAAALREMQEELGVVSELTHVETYLSRRSRETHMQALFTGVHEGPFNPNIHEVDLVQFYSHDQIKNMENSLTEGAKQAFIKLGIL